MEERGSRGEKDRFSIFHFPFSIFYFLFSSILHLFIESFNGEMATIKMPNRK